MLSVKHKYSNSIKARRYPLSYVLSGYYHWGNGNLNRQDSLGYWWSTAASSDSNAYYLSMLSSGLNPQSNYNRAYGFALRCVSLGFTFSRRYPLSYVMSGDYYWYGDNGGWLGYQNEFIFAWTSTTTDSTKAINLGVHNNNLNPVSEYPKNVGMALRSTSARRYPLSYVFSGNYHWGNGNLVYQDSNGRWWSTAADSSNIAYSLYMDSSNLYPQGNDNKANGFPLRCISYSTKFPSVSAFVCILRPLLLGR